MNVSADVLERALEAERTRNGRQIATVRLVGVCAVFAVNSLFFTLRTAYEGASTPQLGVYCVAAALLWAAQRRSVWFARWGGLSIALVDMPAIFAIVSTVGRELRTIGFEADAAAVATQVCLFYLVFIWSASLTLRAPYIWGTAAVAIGLQTLLLVQESRDISGIIIVGMATVMGTYLSLYTRQRSMALLEAAALEQSRRERLGRYFSPHVAAAVIDAEADFAKGQTREVSVLFADIRDFTALSERLRSDQVVDILNEFHSRMVDCIFGRGGTLDKYLGDGLMAYFGAPVDQPDHADRAVLCALDMQQVLAGLNRDLERRGVAALRMGIGVHSGAVILGDIGATRRREFTIIGDTVNVAARVEQLTKVIGAPVLLTEETRRRVATALGFVAVEPLPVKGKSALLQTYRVQPTSAGGTEAS